MSIRIHVITDRPIAGLESCVASTAVILNRTIDHIGDRNSLLCKNTFWRISAPSYFGQAGLALAAGKPAAGTIMALAKKNENTTSVTVVGVCIASQHLPKFMKNTFRLETGPAAGPG